MMHPFLVAANRSTGCLVRASLFLCLIVLVCFPRPTTSQAMPPRPGQLASMASHVNRCGDISAGLHSLTTRNVRCRAARRFVLRYERCHGSSCSRFQGYRCSYRSIVEGVSDEFRCVRGARVIRWQVGS